jgi:hypothetical protein
MTRLGWPEEREGALGASEVSRSQQKSDLGTEELWAPTRERPCDMRRPNSPEALTVAQLYVESRLVERSGKIGGFDQCHVVSGVQEGVFETQRSNCAIVRIENEETRQGEIKYVRSKRVACGKLKRVGASIFGEGMAETH